MQIEDTNASGHAFSPDSRLLAVETGKGAILLVDPGTGKEYARLEDPHQARSAGFCFNPDGTRLVVTSNDSQAVHVWDLRAIRRQLAERGLDWNLPPYSDPPRPDPAALTGVTVDLGEVAKVVPE